MMDEDILGVVIVLRAPDGSRWTLAAGPHVALNGPRGGMRSVREIADRSLNAVEIKVVEK